MVDFFMLFLSVGVAVEARMAFVDIPTDIVVLIVRFGLAVFMAEDAFEDPRIARRDVAILATAPFPTVGAAVDREEIVVVPIHIVPIVGVVAGLAGGGETRGDVVGIGAVVVVGVTGETIGRSSGITPRMA